MDPKLDASGVLTFGNAAVQHGFAQAPASYRATWSTFDNATGEAARVGAAESTTTRLQPPADLRAAPRSFV